MLPDTPWERTDQEQAELERLIEEDLWLQCAHFNRTANFRAQLPTFKILAVAPAVCPIYREPPAQVPPDEPLAFHVAANAPPTC